jgi:hypothetical protein
MTVADVADKYIEETVKHMDYSELEHFAKMKMREALEDMSDQEIINEIRDSSFSYITDKYYDPEIDW